LKAPDEFRAQARHSDSLPLAVLIAGAASLLNQNGKLALVLPFESLHEVQQLAAKSKLLLLRICRVKPNPQKAEFRILAELSISDCSTREENLMIEFEQHFDYTPEYRELTRDFYLKF